MPIQVYIAVLIAFIILLVFCWVLDIGGWMSAAFSFVIALIVGFIVEDKMKTVEYVDRLVEKVVEVPAEPDELRNVPTVPMTFGSTNVEYNNLENTNE